MFTKRAVSNGEGNGTDFLKIEPGSSVTGVFRGQPYEFYQMWPKGGVKKTSAEPFPGASARWKVNFIIYDGAGFVAKIWEFGVRVNNMLAVLCEDCDIATTKVRITRTGSEKNTVWTITPVLKEPLTAKQLKEIGAVELKVLDGVERPQADASADGGEVPF